MLSSDVGSIFSTYCRRFLHVRGATSESTWNRLIVSRNCCRPSFSQVSYFCATAVIDQKATMTEGAPGASLSHVGSLLLLLEDRADGERSRYRLWMEASAAVCFCMYDGVPFQSTRNSSWLQLPLLATILQVSLQEV